jgi:two-component system LytT family response regulator/two-component system response regulator LytT
MPISTIRALVVDDEKPARDELVYLLGAFPEIQIEGQGKNGVEALSLIKEFSPDIVFLDVQMPGLDGFGVIKKLAERKMRAPQIIFVTAYDHYAVQAFEVSAVDYVLKPFDKARLAKAIARAKKMLDTNGPSAEGLENLMKQLGAAKAQPVKLLVKAQQRMLLVDAEDVVYASITDGLITMVAKDI